jgi:hypothetical protein
VPTISATVSPVDAGQKLIHCGSVDTEYIPSPDKELEEVEVDEDYDSTRHKLSGPISEEDFDPSDLTCITPASARSAATSVTPAPALSAAAVAGPDPRAALVGAGSAILAYALLRAAKPAPPMC